MRYWSGGIVVLYSLVREGLSEMVTTEQSLEGGEGGAM